MAELKTRQDKMQVAVDLVGSAGDELSICLRIGDKYMTLPEPFASAYIEEMNIRHHHLRACIKALLQPRRACSPYVARRPSDSKSEARDEWDYLVLSETLALETLKQVGG